MNNPYFSLIKSIWHYGAKWRLSIVSLYIAYIIGQAVLSLGPYALGQAMNALQVFEPSKLNSVIFWLSMIAVAQFIFWSFHGPARIYERRLALRIQQAFRINIYENLTRLPLKWHQDNHSGDIITRVNRSSLALFQFSETQFIYIETSIRFLTSIGFLLWISVPIGIISLVASLSIMGTVILFDKKLIPLYRAENEIDNQVGAVLFDYLSNMTTVLTLRLGELTKNSLFNRMMSVWPFFRRDTTINETKWFVMDMLLNIVQIGILIGYIVYTLNTQGSIMIGVAVMVLRYQGELGAVFRDLSIHYSQLARYDTDIKGINPIIDDIKKLAHLPQGRDTARQWHQIQINHLKFHHRPGEIRGQVFEDVNFNFNRGDKIALIGTSGGGKSTLLNLLSGLYLPSSVNLNIDQVNFDKLEPLQAITTLIPQDPELFENTIEFNITMGLPTDPADIANVIELAGFTNILNSLPLGLQTEVREKGLNLSVGQKQRLALARGIFAARFSSLILMDEPTSSVDLATEKLILGNMIKAFPTSTIMISLHRLHLLPKFDRIIMLDQGNVVANDSAEKLLNEPGRVRDLWLAYQQDAE